MRLQINARGAWRDVVDFDDAKLFHVQAAVTRLAGHVGDPDAGGGRAAAPKWRIIEPGSASPKVVGYCGAPDFTWRKP